MQVQRHIEKVTSQRLVIDVPEAFLNREVEVVVLLVEDEKHESLSAPNGDRAADLLAKISQNDGARCFGDPLVWLPDAKRTIEQFVAMPKDWDGYGAMPIAKETASNVLVALETILNQAPMPDLTPNPNGTISLEWESPHGVGHLEIGRTRYSFYVKPKVYQTKFFDGIVSQIPSDLGAWVASLLFPDERQVMTMSKISFDRDSDVYLTR